MHGIRGGRLQGIGIEAEFLQALDEPLDGALPGAWVDACRVAVLEHGAMAQDVIDGDGDLVGDRDEGTLGAAAGDEAAVLLAQEGGVFGARSGDGGLHQGGVRWILPFRTWVALDRLALRPLPGQVPDQAVNRVQVGKATTSGPTSARITMARVRSTPGMVHRRAMISP